METIQQVEKLVTVVVFLVKHLPIDQSIDIQNASNTLLEMVHAWIDINKDSDEETCFIENERPVEKDDLADKIEQLENVKIVRKTIHMDDVQDQLNINIESECLQSPVTGETEVQLSVSEKRRIRERVDKEKCPLCPTLQYPSRLYDHVVFDHVKEKDDPVYQEILAIRRPLELICSECGKLFTTHKNWANHMKENHSELIDDLYKRKCEQCDKTFKSTAKVTEHIKLVHDINESKCIKCGKSFQNSFKLRRHIRTTHNQEFAKTCKECGKRFNNAFLFKNHVDQDHLGIFKHKCKACGAVLRSFVGLQRHMRMIHEESRMVQCEDCEFTSSHLRTLNLHRLRNHQKDALLRKDALKVQNHL